MNSRKKPRISETKKEDKKVERPIVNVTSYSTKPKGAFMRGDSLDKTKTVREVKANSEGEWSFLMVFGKDDEEGNKRGFLIQQDQITDDLLDCNCIDTLSVIESLAKTMYDVFVKTNHTMEEVVEFITASMDRYTGKPHESEVTPVDAREFEKAVKAIVNFLDFHREEINVTKEQICSMNKIALDMVLKRLYEPKEEGSDEIDIQ